MSQTSSGCLGVGELIEALARMLSGINPGTPASVPVPPALTPALLLEPLFDIQDAGAGSFEIRKPRVQFRLATQPPDIGFDVVSRHPSRAAAEKALSAPLAELVRPDASDRSQQLPRVRLPRKLHYMQGGRVSPVAPDIDWRADPDALSIEADMKAIVQLSPTVAAIEQITPYEILMTILEHQATGWVSIDPRDLAEARSQGRVPWPLMHIDPPRKLRGRLQLAGVFAHELSHCYEQLVRGFLLEDAAPLLTLDEFVLLGLQGEFEGFQLEAALLTEVLNAIGPSFDEAIRREIYKDPVARFLADPDRSFASQPGVPLQYARDAVVRTYEDEYRLVHRAYASESALPEVRQAVDLWRTKAPVANEPASAAWSSVAALIADWRAAGAALP